MIWQLDGHRPQTEGAWIAPDAQVIGQVRLGQGASVWFGAVLRGDTDWIEVGEGSNIQDLSCLHVDPGMPLVIGRDVTVGHRAMLHGCRIGDGALIGMGATVLNGAVIGAGALVAAGALVPEGRVIPPATLVMGTPAREVRQLSAQDTDRIRAGAARYRANAQRFAQGLTPLG